jgi:diadenosine tetraphosphate (Ap4A) HIT family hydrolase
MASVFSQIMAGDLPGQFVYEDELCVAIMTIQPVKPGHVLVIPRQEVDHWQDLSDSTAAHLMLVAKKIAAAVKSTYNSTRVGLFIAGFEVAHTHLHIIPADAMSDFNFSDLSFAEQQDLAVEADKIKAVLAAM